MTQAADLAGACVTVGEGSRRPTATAVVRIFSWSGELHRSPSTLEEESRALGGRRITFLLRTSNGWERQATNKGTKGCGITAFRFRFACASGQPHKP